MSVLLFVWFTRGIARSLIKIERWEINQNVRKSKIALRFRFAKQNILFHWYQFHWNTIKIQEILRIEVIEKKHDQNLHTCFFSYTLIHIWWKIGIEVIIIDEFSDRVSNHRDSLPGISLDFFTWFTRGIARSLIMIERWEMNQNIWKNILFHWYQFRWNKIEFFR